MSYAPLDGVDLEDPLEPIPRSVALFVHWRVERGRAAAQGRRL